MPESIVSLKIRRNVSAHAFATSGCTLDRATGTTINAQPYLTNAYGTRWNAATDRLDVVGWRLCLGSIFKALGLTIWGLIAFGLLAIFIFVGYQAALRHRASSAPMVDERTNDRSGQLGPSGKVGSSAPSEPSHDVPEVSAAPRTPDARKRSSNNPQYGQYESAIRHGQQLIDENSAGPADLSIIALSYFSLGDCTDALVWARRAKDSFQAAGLEPDGALRRVAACCGPGRNKPRIALDPAEKARIDRLLSETEAAKSDVGGPLVRLGELYYGFGDYELAIAAIQHGLKKERVAYLDEAYVYLGLSEQAVGDLEEARKAFNQLKDVPGISPRVLRLWTLYAETQLSAQTSPSAPENAECPDVGGSTVSR